MPIKVPKKIKNKAKQLIADSVVEGETVKKVKQSNVARKIEFEVGDAMQDDFFPQFKTKHWDNECNFSARLVTKDGAVTEHDGKLAYDDGEQIARFYEKDTGDEDGGFEFDVVFNSRPKSDVTTWTIQHKELDFFYQPELTQEEIEQGASRPENVVGSYAVYHKTKKNNVYRPVKELGYTPEQLAERRALGLNKVEKDKRTKKDEEYALHQDIRNGKLLQIYRPYYEDANGERTWGELHIDPDANLMTVTAPKGWLDKAAYPVVLDPTFGYTSAGASFGELYNSNDGTTHARATRFTLSEAGDITDLSGYFAVTSGRTGGAKIHLYTNGSSVPSTNIVSTSEDTYTDSTSEFVTGSVMSSLSSGDLWVAGSARLTNETSGGQRTWVKYDSGGDDSSWDFAFNHNTPDTTWSEFAGGTDMLSIYATYTASGGGSPRRIFNIS